jgi:hypothetical protein
MQIVDDLLELLERHDTRTLPAEPIRGPFALSPLRRMVAAEDAAVVAGVGDADLRVEGTCGCAGPGEARPTRRYERVVLDVLGYHRDPF